MFVSRALYKAVCAERDAARNALVAAEARVAALHDRLCDALERNIKTIVELRREGFVPVAPRTPHTAAAPALPSAVESAIQGVMLRTGNRSPAFRRMLTERALELAQAGIAVETIVERIEQGEAVGA